MQHRMTVRADRNKVSDWVEDVFLSDRGDRRDVMHMDEALADAAVCDAEINLADSARGAVLF